MFVDNSVEKCVEVGLKLPMYRSGCRLMMGDGGRPQGCAPTKAGPCEWLPAYDGRRRATTRVRPYEKPGRVTIVVSRPCLFSRLLLWAWLRV